MEKLENSLRKVCEFLEKVGICGYLVMLLVNITDVLGSKFFSWPVPGGIELITFSQVIAIACVLPMGLFLGFHLTVDVLVEKLPQSARKVVESTISLVCAAFFSIIFLQGLEYGYSFQKSGEIGSVSKIPFFPFAYALSFCMAPVAIFYLLRTIKNLKKGAD